MVDCVVVFNYLLQCSLSKKYSWIQNAPYEELALGVCGIRSGCTWRSHMTKRKKWMVGHL